MPRVFPNRDYLHKSCGTLMLVAFLLLILGAMCAGGLKFEKNPKSNPESTKHVKAVGF